MPRRTYGPQVKQRALRLFEALFSFAEDIANQGNGEIEFSWEGKTKLIIKTQTRFLIELTQKDHYAGRLSKPQVVEALQRMEDFLGILEDHRTKKKGTEERHFTLRLYSQDLATNLEKFNLEWEDKRPEKSKEQELVSATPQKCRTIRPKPGVPFQAPPLPPHFVERPEVSHRLKDCLLSEEIAKTGTLVVSAIYGLGGIGKSTLAAALAYDSEVQNNFPDGILWATLGQQPDLLSFLSGWIQSLGDYNYKPTSIKAASRHLQTLLYDKATLLVVDDAWNPEHVEPFRIGGAKCRVLVTTREAQILGATPYYLDVMSPPQAFTLLSEYSGSQLKGTEAKQAQALAKTVGYLPLALELAAAQIVDGISWEELLSDLRKEIALLDSLDLPGAEEVEEKQRKRYSLVASFNLSLKRLPLAKLKQFAWFGVLPEDVSITPALAATLWDVSAREAKKTLQYLKSKALLLFGRESDGTLTYQLHDLVHDLARRLLTGGDGSLPGLGLTLPQAHGQLLERYRQKTVKGLWHTLPGDGYIHHYLTWHLAEAGWVEEVHKLLHEETEAGGNGWYSSCERLGQPAGFVKDVAKAWQLAEEADSISLQCRYALMVSSLYSLVGNIPGELMAALVEKQLWSPALALAYVQQIQDPYWRAEALKEVAAHLPESLLPEALETARALTYESDRALALSGLAAHLPEILPEALETARAIRDESSRAYVLSELAAHLTESLLPEALETARAIQGEWGRAFALTGLAAHLPEILPEALEAARAINGEYHRAKALREIAAYLPEILPEALEAVRAISDESYQVRVLSRLAAHLPEILPEALELARNVTDEYGRAIALSRLAAHRPEILPEALTAARAAENEWIRADALRELAAHLPEILLEALEAARTISDEFDRANALRELAVYFPETLLEALEIARTIRHRDEFIRAYALSELAAHLPEILPEALEAARTIRDEDDRAYALRELAVHFPEILPEALEAALALKKESDRAYALRALITHLPESLLPRLLEAAMAITDNDSRAIVLSRLATHRPEILPEALKAALAIKKEFDRAYALRGLAAHLPEILPEALEAARAISDERNRALVLSGLAAHLPESLLPEALETARAISDERNRAIALSGLAAHLPESLLPEALETARAIASEFHRASALSGLIKNPDFSLHNFWQELLRTLACANRKDFLENLVTLSPTIISLGGKEALAATAEAIRDVSRWWR